MSKFDRCFVPDLSDTQSNICQAVIVKEGKLIYADTWNGYSINDTVYIASVTKSVVALLVGIAIDKGYIDISQQHILDKSIRHLKTKYVLISQRLQLSPPKKSKHC